ncbi:LacI family DNA-binding transcriptional regulator [Promicromonospora iranensis]|uniref:LacI family DNA-binding transcriptional regulator n=1 Tax=Promicromonospora iranensis TaxID=1105144 RepID=UPI0023A991D9|nr:LacI family DNA-binding transcriptional regulator [Promicromonospora iranensis]
MGATPRVSMTDVARRAGVSQKTVSRVVNGEPHVADAIRAKVQEVIDELGFRPNAAARALVTRRNQRIGMVTLSTSLYGPAAILEGVDDALRGSGYYLSVARTQGNSVADLQAAIDELVTQDIAGLVLSEPIDLGHPDLRIPHGLPVLSFDSPAAPTAEERPDQLVMGADETAGARSATDHLLARGHRTVHHLGGTEGWAATARRVEGWRGALADAGAKAPAVVHGDWTPRSGYEAASELLRRGGVTAIFAANDHMAIGAIRAVEKAGLRVPQDVSVVGFDDAPEAEYLSTALTTVRQDFAEVTRLAMHRLVRTIEGRPPAERHRLIPAQLVVRESAAPPPARTAPAPR